MYIYRPAILGSRIIGFVLIVVSLSGCRYWELYRFSQQFCDFNEYITLHKAAETTNVIFDTPLLSRKLLLRYLGSHPYSSTLISSEPSMKKQIIHDMNQTRKPTPQDSFKIERTDDQSKNFYFNIDYHRLDDSYLVKRGILDTKLSAIFTPDMVEPILRSFCTDDYDIEDNQVELRFRIPNLSQHSLPTLSSIKTSFGAPQANPEQSTQPSWNALNYTFRFISPHTLEYHPLNFEFIFDTSDRLDSMLIRYYRYDYMLDFSEGTGRLQVSR